MEKLWADLSSSPYFTTPEWHGDVLARRKNAVKERKLTYTEWNKVKEEITQRMSEKNTNSRYSNDPSLLIAHLKIE